jgi:hypothetical protein
MHGWRLTGMTGMKGLKRLTGWAAAVAVLHGGPGLAKGPKPVPEAELARCADAVRLRLAEATANRELGASQAYLDSLGRDDFVGAALEVRESSGGETELVFAFNETPRIGQTGTFGPYAVTVAATWRQHGVAVVKATVAEAKAQQARDGAVRLQGAPVGVGDVLASWNLPGALAGGMGVAREVVGAAVEAMNAKGGLPWIAWADRDRPQYRRVKVKAAEGDAGGWLPLKDPDSAMHPLWVTGLDLEKSGQPYLLIAINDSPVSDKTEIWRADGKAWKKVGEADGNIAMASREADGRVTLRFDNYLDASVWMFDPTDRTLALGCFVFDMNVMNGLETPWANLTLREGVMKLAESGAGDVPVKEYLEAENPEFRLPRGTRVWRLQTSGEYTQVAFVVPTATLFEKTLEPGLRKAPGRVMTTGWVASTDVVAP